MRTILSELKASLLRNTTMTIALIVTMSVSLLLASLGFLFKAQADRTEEYFGDRLQLQVNTCTRNSPQTTCTGGKATSKQLKAIEKALESHPEVKSVDVRTPDDNFAQAKAVYGQSETGKQQLETLSAESFPFSYYVTLKDPQKFDGVKAQVEQMDGVGSVNSLRQLLGPLFEMLDKLRWAAIGVSVLLILAAILQVSNTIRMTAYARRREIGIMRLVGASSWHIQMPFILEAAFAGLISAALSALGLAAFMKYVVYDYLRERLGEVTAWVRWDDSYQVMAITTILALALALIPTFLLTRRYLDV
jgi:cell division transport system permease protein